MSSDNPFSSRPGGGPRGGEPHQQPAASEPVAPDKAEQDSSASPGVEEVKAEPKAKAFKKAPASSSGELPALEMEETSCRTCQFFHFEADSRVEAAEGECRFNAPRPGLDERAAWPLVEWDSWCGQWNSGISNDDMVKMARIVADRMVDGGKFTK